MKKRSPVKVSPCVFGVTVQPNTYQASYEINNICNLNCLHCCNRSFSNSDKGLPLKKIFALVDDLKKIGTKNIYLTGGEPTLYPYFEKVIRYIHSQEIELILATNGLNTAPYLSTIKKCISPKIGVFVSLDGLNKTHDHLRGVDGAFERVVTSIRLLVKNGIRTRISTVVWSENVREIEPLILLVKSLGAYQIHFSTLINVGKAIRDDSIQINPKDYSAVVVKIHSLIQKYSEKEFIVSTRRDFPLNNRSDYCHAGERIIHINCRGKIFPCSWIAKSPINHYYSAQWREGKIEDCLQKIAKFQDLVQKRILVNGYSGCPAISLEFSGQKYGADPLNKLLVGK